MFFQSPNSLKIMGLTSLGFLSFSFGYQSLNNVSNMIKEFQINLKQSLTSNSLKQILSRILKTINQSLTCFLGLGLASSVFLLSAFIYAPSNKKHPYLLYTSSGTFVLLSVLCRRLLKIEKNIRKKKVDTDQKNQLVNKSTECNELNVKKTDCDSNLIQISEFETESQSGSLKKINDDCKDISVQSNDHSPSSSLESNKIKNEVESVLMRKDIVKDLTRIKDSYSLASIISAAVFIMGFIGLIGDYYL